MVARLAIGLVGLRPPTPIPSPETICTRAALLRFFRPPHDDYAATIALTADPPGQEGRAVIDARHEVYAEALAEVLTTEAIETSAGPVRGGKVVRR